MPIDFDPTPRSIALCEKPDPKALAYLEKNFMALGIQITSSKDEKMDMASSAREFKKYTKMVREGGNVEYAHRNKNAPGRLSTSSLSIIRLPKEITHTLYRGKVDCDQVCSHPTIAAEILDRWGMKSEYIRDYLANREKRLAQTMSELGVDRKTAKEFFNAILFGSNAKKMDNASPEFRMFYDGFFREGRALMDRVSEKYPSLRKEADKKKAVGSIYSAEGSTLSYFLGNFETQITLAAIEFVQRRGVEVFGYSFDGFLMDRPADLSTLLLELDAHILATTGFPIRFADKEMDRAILIPSEVQVEVEVEVPPIPWEEDMEYNHFRVANFCLTWEQQLLGEKNKKKVMARILEYCDQFFATIEDEKNGIVRERFHLVNGMRRRLEFVRCKNWPEYTMDKNVFSTRRGEDGKPILLFSLRTLTCYPERRKYARFGFYPKIEENTKFFNTFAGFNFVDNGEVVDERIEPILDHWLNVTCGGVDEYYHHWIRCMAHAVQRPWEPLGIAIILRGPEGIGKGVSLDPLAKIIGMMNEETCTMGAWRTVKNQSDIFGTFTTILEGACALFLDEMVWGGDKKSAGILKALVTEATSKIEAKGESPYFTKAYHNVFMCSNEDWVVPADKKSRRWFVLEPSDRWGGVQTTESKAYFDRIVKVPTQMIANYLYRFPIEPDWNPRAFPETEALIQQKEESIHVVHEWFRQQVSKSEEEWTWNGLRKNFIFECFMNWAKESNQSVTFVPNQTFWKKLRELGVGDKKIKVEGQLDRAAVFPTYGEAKEIFTKVYGFEPKE